MRVTERMIYDSAALYAGRARDEVQTASAEVSTGLKLTHASDDPSAAGQVITHTLAQDRLTAILGGVQQANTDLQTADSALGTVSTALSRAKELAVQYSNDTTSASDRAAAGTEVQSLIGEVITAMNAKSGNRYLFGGTKDSAPPFDTTTGAYLGDSGVQRIEVAPGVLQTINVRADQAIAGQGGGVDVIGALKALQTALGSSSTTSIQGAMGGLDASIAQVANARGQSGAVQASLDAASAANTTTRDSEKKQISGLQDADAIEATTKLAMAQQGLQAALTASAQTFQISLLDYLK
jgi:flagellar hook-associated protein 3 FlgL